MPKIQAKRGTLMPVKKKKEVLGFSDYQKHAANLISPEGQKDLLLNGVLGLTGESGECADIIKKVRFQGHTLDAEHLEEELGDVLWYIAETATGLGVSLEDVAQKNLDKLHQRYHGEKFNAADSRNRDPKDGKQG
jgi:NTP pyrophosphatase (non-canonical NTP hydrolase)